MVKPTERDCMLAAKTQLPWISSKTCIYIYICDYDDDDDDDDDAADDDDDADDDS